MSTFRYVILMVCPIVAASLASTAAEKDRPLVFGVNRVGDAAVLHNPPDYEEHLYRRIREAGGTCVRLVASPRDIEPVRGKRDWKEFDHDLALAIKYEQEPMVCIVNIPAWASPTGEATHAYPYKTEMLPDFASFCTELAQRTRGKVRYFQLWNEQNGCGWHCQDGFNMADEYFPMLVTCYAALKKGNPDCVLSLGSLDDAEGHAPIFLRKTYEEMKKHSVTGPLFDVVSDHPYSENSKIMRGKLDALREILNAQGDGGKPFWITEYGWHTGNTPPKEQAAKLAEVLEAFIQPAWKDLEAAVYLCIADFEGTHDGFGLTDANLRPKPAFYAFQAASRFGAYPAYQIEPRFVAADRLVITYKTLKPAAGRVTLAPGRSERPANAASQPSAARDEAVDAMTKESVSGTEHKVEFDRLKPDTDYHFVIETASEASGTRKSIRSAIYDVRTPGPQIRNGDFEGGFFAGIAHGWRIEGQGFCTDASLVPNLIGFHGQHAQAVFSFGGKELASTLSTMLAATPGKPVEISFYWAARRTEASGEINARAGIDPAGGTDPKSSGIKWTDWQVVKRFGGRQSVSTTASNSVITLFIQCGSEQAPGEGQAVFMLDNVQAVQP